MCGVHIRRQYLNTICNTCIMMSSHLLRVLISCKLKAESEIKPLLVKQPLLFLYSVQLYRVN